MDFVDDRRQHVPHAGALPVLRADVAPVGASSPVDDVHTRTAVQVVVAVVPRDNVVAFAAGHDVVAVGSGEAVVARPALDPVVAGTGIDAVAAGAARDRVV